MTLPIRSRRSEDNPTDSGVARRLALLAASRVNLARLSTFGTVCAHMSGARMNQNRKAEKPSASFLIVPPHLGGKWAGSRGPEWMLFRHPERGRVYTRTLGLDSGGTGRDPGREAWFELQGAPGRNRRKRSPRRNTRFEACGILAGCSQLCQSGWGLFTASSCNDQAGIPVHHGSGHVFRLEGGTTCDFQPLCFDSSLSRRRRGAGFVDRA